MIEIGRRGFFTGLAALVAAPAIIRVAPLMPISTRFTPRYVPVNWLADDILFQKYRMEPLPLGEPLGEEWLAVRAKGMELLGLVADLKKHAWPSPLGDNWIDLNDYDPKFAREWANRIESEERGRGQSWWGEA